MHLATFPWSILLFVPTQSSSETTSPLVERSIDGWKVAESFDCYVLYHFQIFIFIDRLFFLFACMQIDSILADTVFNAINDEMWQ